jgi:hypothetical protein
MSRRQWGDNQESSLLPNPRFRLPDGQCTRDCRHGIRWCADTGWRHAFTLRPCGILGVFTGSLLRNDRSNHLPGSPH